MKIKRTLLWVASAALANGNFVWKSCEAELRPKEVAEVSAAVVWVNEVALMIWWNVHFETVDHPETFIVLQKLVCHYFYDLSNRLLEPFTPNYLGWGPLTQVNCNYRIVKHMHWPRLAFLDSMSVTAAMWGRHSGIFSSFLSHAAE